MDLISKSIHKPDVEADDRLIASMEKRYYKEPTLRDIIIARYRSRNLRMRVLETFIRTMRSKNLIDEAYKAIKAIDAELATAAAPAQAEVAPAPVLAADVAFAPTPEAVADNVIPATVTAKKRAGKRARKARQAALAAIGEEQKTG